jgi:hypothetical protein
MPISNTFAPHDTQSRVRVDSKSPLQPDIDFSTRLLQRASGKTPVGPGCVG